MLARHRSDRGGRRPGGALATPSSDVAAACDEVSAAEVKEAGAIRGATSSQSAQAYSYRWLWEGTDRGSEMRIGATRCCPRRGIRGREVALARGVGSGASLPGVLPLGLPVGTQGRTSVTRLASG